MTKQLLIVPSNKRFTPEQKAELRDAGFVVLYMNNPKDARLVSPERPALSASELSLLGLQAVRMANSYAVYQHYIEGLIAAYSAALKGGEPAK